MFLGLKHNICDFEDKTVFCDGIAFLFIVIYKILSDKIIFFVIKNENTYKSIGIMLNKLFLKVEIDDGDY